MSGTNDVTRFEGDMGLILAPSLRQIRVWQHIPLFYGKGLYFFIMYGTNTVVFSVHFKVMKKGVKLVEILLLNS
jgi:hypothetical protein